MSRREGLCQQDEFLRPLAETPTHFYRVQSESNDQRVLVAQASFFEWVNSHLIMSHFGPEHPRKFAEDRQDGCVILSWVCEAFDMGLGDTSSSSLPALRIHAQRLCQDPTYPWSFGQQFLTQAVSSFCLVPVSVFSNDLWGILLKCKFWFSRYGLGLDIGPFWLAPSWCGCCWSTLHVREKGSHQTSQHCSWVSSNSSHWE